MKLLDRIRRNKAFDYIMFDDHGNVVDVWPKKKAALAALKEMVKVDPETADTVAIFSISYYGQLGDRIYPKEDDA